MTLPGVLQGLILLSETQMLPLLPGGSGLALTQIPDVGIRVHVLPAVLEVQAAISHGHGPVAVGVPGEVRGHPLGRVGVPLG